MKSEPFVVYTCDRCGKKATEKVDDMFHWWTMWIDGTLISHFCSCACMCVAIQSEYDSDMATKGNSFYSVHLNRIGRSDANPESSSSVVPDKSESLVEEDAPTVRCPGCGSIDWNAKEGVEVKCRDCGTVFTQMATLCADIEE